MGECQKEEKVKIGVVANPKKVEAKEVLETLKKLCKGEVLIFSDELKSLLSEDDKTTSLKELPQNCDLIFSFGGDGTFLKAARFSKGKPLAGINLGGLGFLTTFRKEELTKLVESVLSGDFKVDERMSLVAKRTDGREFFALNDITIVITGSSRMIEVEVSAGADLLNRYRADGVIVATPTGSTAYNLASGGPVVHPMMDAILVTPICAHTLSVRTVILPATVPVYIISRSKGEKILLSADGQDETLLTPGEKVEIIAKPKAVKVIRLPDTPPFFEILRMKLGWG